MLPRRSSATLCALAAAGALAACGGTDQRAERPKSDPQQAFLRSMVPHHRSAVEMARVAEREARTDFVQDLADDITRTQTAEVAEMRRIHRELFDSSLRPDMDSHMALGLSATEAGMNHMDGARSIRGERPFDRAFVDEMIPHHEGAIRMAEAVLDTTRDPQLRRLAEDIIAAQTREIEAMERFRERRYGGRNGAAPEEAVDRRGEDG